MPVKKSALSPARRRLVDLLGSIQFGRIESLAIRDGEPILEPPPRILRTVKLDGEERPSDKLESGDFVLKKQVVQMLQQFDRLGAGTVVSLDVHHGVPLKMTLEDTYGQSSADARRRQENPGR